MKIETIFAISAIYFFYMLYGIAQESLNFTAYYDPKTGNKVHWHFTLSTLIFQCISNCFVGMIQMKIFGHKNSQMSYSTYFSISSLYISAMFASNYALEFVDYPTQVLCKSCKIIPVMVLGLLFGTKYPLRKWICMILVSFGISIFVLKDFPFFPYYSDNNNNNSSNSSNNHHSSSKHSNNHKKTISEEREEAEKITYYIGIAFLALSLSLDGIYSNLQERARRVHAPSAGEQMFWMNAMSVILLLVIDIPFFGHLIQSYHFALQHPAVLWHLLSFSICSALGQIFIFYLMVNGGVLFVTTVTTTRKFFTILISVLYFVHPVNLIQWLGVAFVFIGLAMDDHVSTTSSKKRE